MFWSNFGRDCKNCYGKQKQPYRVSSSRAGSNIWDIWAQQPHFSAMRSSSCHRSTLKIQPPFSPVSAISDQTQILDVGRSSDIDCHRPVLKSLTIRKTMVEMTASITAGTGELDPKAVNVSTFPQFFHSCGTCERCEPSILGHAKFDGRSAIPWKIWGHGNYAKIPKANLPSDI